MNALVDSNIFIGAYHKSDPHNDSCIGILNRLKEGQIRMLYTTNYAVTETISFLLKKIPFETVLEAYRYMTGTERIKVAFVEPGMMPAIELLFEKYKTLTLADCSLMALGFQKGIKTIFSIDAGFDKVKGTVRLEK